MDIGFEVSKLIRFSPKRKATLERIKLENVYQDSASHGIRAFCQNRWIVRAEAIDSILENYTDLNNCEKNAWELEKLILT